MNKKNWFLIGLLGIILMLSLVFSCGGLEDPEEPDPDETLLTVAKRPVISDLASRNYVQGDIPEALSVTATVEEGDLSYEWYRNTTLSTSGATIISGFDVDSYLPSTAIIGETYYYVVVTNTDTSKDIPTATLTSNIVRIKVVETADTDPPRATITVDTATRYQKIAGFGAMSSVWDKPALNERDIDTLFSPDGLGLNILRVMIYPYMDDLLNGTEGAPSDDPDAHKRYYDMVRQAKSYGAYILASPWTPPAELKENNDRYGAFFTLDGEGKKVVKQKIIGNDAYVEEPAPLRKDRWGNYAQHLKDYISRMAANNASIDYISLQNEPDLGVDYDGCYWAGEDMRDFIKQYARQIAPANGSIKIMPGESFNFGQPYPMRTSGNYYAPIYNDPEAMAAIDLIGGHIYGNGLMRHAWALDAGKEVWMTEYLTNTAAAASDDPRWRNVWDITETVHKCMAADFSAYVWWLAKRYYCLIGDDWPGTGTPDGQPLYRGYALSHYAKYATGKTRVKADFRMTTGSNSNVFVTAYESDNEITLVLFNKHATTSVGRLHIDLPVPVTGASMVITKGESQNDVANGQKMAPQIIVLSSDKTTGILDLPASSIISVRFTK